MNKRLLFLTIPLITCLLATACNAVSAAISKPTVVITSPPSNSQFRIGDQVVVQSTSTDPAGIDHVELAVDGAVVRTDASPKPHRTLV